MNSKTVKDTPITQAVALETLRSMIFGVQAASRLSQEERDAITYAIKKLEAPISSSMIDINSAYLRGYNQGRKNSDRLTAHWVANGFEDKCTCSNCGAVPSVWKASRDLYSVTAVNKFCRNCGAEMIQEEV